MEMMSPRGKGNPELRALSSSAIVSTRLEELRRLHGYPDSKGKSSSNEVELAGQGVGSQKQRDVSPSSQGAREENHGEEGSSSLGSERQVDFYVSRYIIELNNKNIQQKEYRGRIEYILKRIDSLREWEDNNNSADKCEINYNIQGGEKLEVSDSKEVGQNLNLSMDWGDKSSHITENERDIDENKQYDAFISYNYVDKEKVIKIVENLKKEQIVLCMDGGEQCSEDEMERRIKNSKSMVVFIGEHGMEERQKEENAAFFRYWKWDGERPIIPVLLHDRQKLTSPLSLANRVWVNFDYNKPNKSLLKLMWGITGKNRNTLNSNEYDVFMSYNSKDKKLIKKIAKKLKEGRILSWLDNWELRPGIRATSAVELGMEKSKSIAVFIGEHGVGPWQKDEIDYCSQLSRQEEGRLIISVLLSGCPKSKLPRYLASQVCIDFDSNTFDKSLQVLKNVLLEKYQIK